MKRRMTTIVVFVLLMLLAVASLGHDREARERDAIANGQVFEAVVEIESLQVISWVDSAGVEHPAGPELVAPIPVRGPRRLEVTVLDDEADQTETARRP